MVFYLKYRPKNLAELDNQDVAGLIAKYLKQETLPHAFLFTGPRGTGKTSTARIVAKAINCKEFSKLGEPCDKCETCQEITKGSHLDILEIDAASNRGIDEIRELREKIKLSPVQLKYKVYIIDEVHMLTTEAFNALLKTLEEPPQHAIFILATTEIHKVPETIISRCVKVNFHRATVEEIKRSLQRIIKAEKIDIDDTALAEIAQISDGSFRDAAKILEELALDKVVITTANINKIIGTADKSIEAEFINSLNIKNAKNLLLIIQQLNNQGKNIRQFFINILNELKTILLNQYLDNSKQSNWDKTDLLKIIDKLSLAFVNLKTTMIPSLPFEIAIVEYCENYDQTVNPAKITAKQTISIDEKVDPNAKNIMPEWPQILDALKPFNHSLVGVLRSCQPISYKDNILVLEAAYKFHAERISNPKTLDVIAKVVSQVMGNPVKIETVIRKR